MPWTSSQFRFEGGLNEEDPQFTQKPGAAAFMQNYECLPGGGYRRIGGYEIWSYEYPAETEKVYKKLAFTGGTIEPDPRGYITITSGSLAAVLIAVDLVSGSWGAGDAEGWLILTYDASATPVDGDEIMRNGVPFAYTYAGGFVDAELSDTRYAEWIEQVKDYYRESYRYDVGGFGQTSTFGEGPVLGMFTFEDKLYAWRKETSSGDARLWRLDTLGGTEIFPTPYLPFDDGTAELAPGDSIVGGTSGATATVIDVNIAIGNFAGPTFASGRLFVENVVGTFQNNEEIRIGPSKRALVNGTLTTPTATDGAGFARHKTIETNFYGIDNRTAVYGVDGYNDPYVFDGTNLMYFDNTMASKPKYVEVHRNHLFLAYSGGSIQNSATGLPMVWSVRLGASELGIGDEPTGMRSNGNNTLAISAENSVHIITGTSDADWNIRIIADEMISIQNTLASIGGQTLFLDHAGVSKLLPAPPTFQDYTTQQISRTVRKTIEAKAENALFALAVPGKNQYWLFFDDKTVLTATFFANKLVGWSKAKFLDQMTCACYGTVDGEAHVFMGTEDGYALIGDYGPSFAGGAIESIIQLPFCYHGNPDREKRFHKITLEMETPATIDLRIHMDFDYGTGAQTGNFATATGATGGQWDVSRWEQFFWDSGVLTAPETNIDGVGRNAAITLYHNTRTAEPFTISAALLQFSLYGVKR